mmetsp:Transcript_9451/g.31402  ORF Transcript_9451/g.31402 Transcript_9451/m.31402 type:complete len:95 (+) Transcript_9451:1443-1727(+)
MNSSLDAVPTGAGMSSSAARDAGCASSSAVAVSPVGSWIARTRVEDARCVATRRGGARARDTRFTAAEAEADIAKELMSRRSRGAWDARACSAG